jgi:hypothetical protein
MENFKVKNDFTVSSVRLKISDWGKKVKDFKVKNKILRF